MIKKYQFFVSSTYLDLKQERKEIFNILLRSNCIPSGMEFFPSIDLEQFKLIKKNIELCDYYLLIIKKRYGSVCSATNKSYTEMEYDYAIQKDIPVIAFVYDVNVHDKRLKSFITKVTTDRTVSFWRNKSELIKNVATSINNLLSLNNRPGWIRETTHDITTNVKQETIYSNLDFNQIKKTLLDKEDFNSVNIGEKLYYIWKTEESKQGISKEEFATYIGVPTDEIDDYFKGNKMFFDYSLLLRVITLFNLPDDYFIKPTYLGEFAFWKRDSIRFSILQKVTPVSKIEKVTPAFYYNIIMSLAAKLEWFSDILDKEGLDENPFSESNGKNYFSNYNITPKEVKRNFEVSYYKILELSDFNRLDKKLSPIEQIVQRWFFLDDAYLSYLFTVCIESIDISNIEQPVINYTFMNDLINGNITWFSCDDDYYNIKKEIKKF